jgi:hypothetical protein
MYTCIMPWNRNADILTPRFFTHFFTGDT